MTKEEWLKRCAKRFKDRAGLTDEEAAKLAIECFDSYDFDENFSFSVAIEYSPEDCADEEMSHWDEPALR